jgi:hypothetical protein
MRRLKGLTKGVVLLALLGATPAAASAARVRYHYAAADACGTVVLKPDGPCGGIGERVSWFGTVRQAECAAPRPNQVLSFRHPCTGRLVSVPAALPEGTPNVEYRTHLTVFNYGSYTVEFHFLAGGAVDVVYDSGLFRAP